MYAVSSLPILINLIIKSFQASAKKSDPDQKLFRYDLAITSTENIGLQYGKQFDKISIQKISNWTCIESQTSFH